MKRNQAQWWLISLLLVVGAVYGCNERVEVSNLPGHTTFVGPIQASEDEAGAVVTWFGVSDPEGDFVSVAAEICVEGGECYVPELLPGSATVETLPAVREGESPALKLIWQPDCAMMSATSVFTVSIQVLGSDIDPLESTTTSLADMGLACP